MVNASKITSAMNATIPILSFLVKITYAVLFYQKYGKFVMEKNYKKNNSLKQFPPLRML